MSLMALEGNTLLNREIMSTRIFTSIVLASLSISIWGQNIWEVSNTLSEGPGSFADAIFQAQQEGADTIIFNIPMTDAGFDAELGIWSIESEFGFTIPAATYIDGGISSAEDVNNRPAIEIHGVDTIAVPVGTGVVLENDVTLRNVTINRFRDGIRTSAENIRIEHCYIGTDPSGLSTESNSNTGILIGGGARQVMIANNLLSGNTNSGIIISGPETSDVIVTHNFIGTNIAGMYGLPGQTNGIQVLMGAKNNLFEENLISGNQQYGVFMTDMETTDNVFVGNVIGADESGSVAMPNGVIGIAIFNGPSKNIIGPGNRVAFNGEVGVLIDGSNGMTTIENLITNNSITQNGKKGISVIRSGNWGLIPPQIDSIVEDRLYGRTEPNLMVELFFDVGDEGCCFIGRDSADASGDFAFNIPDPNPEFSFITAVTFDTAGNTSEFSTPFCAPLALPVKMDTVALCPQASAPLEVGDYESYLWSTGATESIITISDPGLYRVTVTDTNGCKGEGVFFVEEAPSPNVMINPTSLDCAITYLSADEYVHYLWSTGDTTPGLQVFSAGTYSLTVTDEMGCLGSDSIEILNDPLSIPWVKDLISNPFNPYCDECLTLSHAMWMDQSVLIYEWDAASCNFTDLGFYTVYNCSGDTLQHCNNSIAGVDCDPDSLIENDDLINRQLLWQCQRISLPECPIDNEEILDLAWLNDTLKTYEPLCTLACIGGNAGASAWKHVIDSNVILEVRPACGDVTRKFFDCEGSLLYSCTSFSEAGTEDCSLPFLPGMNEGELIWDCSMTTSTAQENAVHPYKLYPTLVLDELVVESFSNEPWRISIYDSFGHLLISRKSRMNKEVLDTQFWPQGVLFAYIKGQDKFQVFKFVKAP